MMQRRFKQISLSALAAIALAGPTLAADDTLKVYLLLGQSNADGHAYTWDFAKTAPDVWNVPTLEYLSNNQAYYDTLPDNVYSFKESFDANWIETPRDDVWGVKYKSSDASNVAIRTTEDTTIGDNSTPAHPTGVVPLSVGFGSAGKFRVEGGNIQPSAFGPELGMAHSLGDAMNSPILLYKSVTGGTTLAEDWRPPSAAARSGVVGEHYTNTLTRFTETLDQLDQDIADGVLDDKYNGATDYEVAGVIWIQGFNEVVESGGAFIPEYDQNLVDLANDIRAADERIGDSLPIMVVESSDQNADLNAERQAAVDALNAADPGSAVFLEMNGLLGENFGGLNTEGDPFTNSYGSHFHSRAENYLELGYRIGDALVENGFTGSEVVPEPTSLMLLGAGSLLLAHRRGR